MTLQGALLLLVGPNLSFTWRMFPTETAHHDERVPEALHLVVRSTRYGCTDAETTKWSEKAFRLLHEHYPKSVWTVKTKYYF
jgi:hypothetical protein